MFFKDSFCFQLPFKECYESLDHAHRKIQMKYANLQPFIFGAWKSQCYSAINFLQLKLEIIPADLVLITFLMFPVAITYYVGK